MSDEHRFPDGRPVPYFLKPIEVAEWLRIPRRQVYDAIKNNELECNKLSLRMYITTRPAVLAWINP